MKKQKKDYCALLCDDCGTEIFVDVNMVMLDDELWKEVSKGKIEEAYCDHCIEKRLGRPIIQKDLLFVPANLGQTALCNMLWMIHKKEQQELQ